MLTIASPECSANWHNTNLSSLGKGIGFGRGFTPLASALNRTSALSIYTHRSIKIRPFTLSAIMHQAPAELPMVCSPKLNHMQNHMQEIKPASRDMISSELPGTFSDRFIQMLEEADLIVSASGREILKGILREIPLMPLTLTAQELILGRLKELPTNAQKGVWQSEEEQHDEIKGTADDLFLSLMEAK